MLNSKFILVLTAGDIEFDSVCEQFQCKSNKIKSSFVGSVPHQIRQRSASVQDYTIIVISAQASGPRGSWRIAREIEEIKPCLCIFSGVAGGLSKQIALNTVVIADQIVSLDTQTHSTVDESLSIYYKPQVLKIEERLIVIANEVAQSHTWTEHLQQTDGQPNKAATQRLLVGPIGSSSTLVKTSASPLVFALLDTVPGALAIEMESAY